jgi:hypothetical protein
MNVVHVTEKLYLYRLHKLNQHKKHFIISLMPSKFRLLSAQLCIPFLVLVTGGHLADFIREHQHFLSGWFQIGPEAAYDFTRL